VRDLVGEARMPPSITFIFIDEIDALGSRRAATNRPDAPQRGPAAPRGFDRKVTAPLPSQSAVLVVHARDKTLDAARHRVLLGRRESSNALLSHLPRSGNGLHPSARSTRCRLLCAVGSSSVAGPWVR
jgi:ATP-dependent Zn protease